MKNAFLAMTLLSALAAGPASAASIVGNTVTCMAGAYGACSSTSATVGNAVEYNQYQINYDFNSTGLNISNTSSGGIGFGGNVADFVLRFADTTNPFTTATLGTVNGVTGLQSNTFTLANGVLSVGLGGLNFTRGAGFSINLGTAAVAGAVPEPASWAMLILGMAMVGYAMRRSNVRFDAKIKRMTTSVA